MPAWAEFVYGFGRWLATQPLETEKWHVLTFPGTRMVSGMLAAGFASARFESLDFYSRESIEALSDGDQITWLDSHSQLSHGTFGQLTISELDPPKNKFSYVCSRRGAMSRYTEYFDKYRFSRFDGAPFVHARPLSRNFNFLDAFAPGRVIDLTTQSKNEICLVGDQEIRNDLLAQELSCEGTIGCLDDILRVKDLDDVRESPHHLSLYVNPASRSLSEVEADFTVYDGSRAVSRQRNYVNSFTSVVVLNRWDIHAREVLSSLKSFRTRSRGSSVKLATTLSLPKGIEYMGWSIN